MVEQVFNQAHVLAGDLSQRQVEWLHLLCQTVVSMLTARLKKGLTPKDCGADFVAAASLLALAGLSEAQTDGDVERFTAGDVTIQRRSGNAASACLRSQARMIIAPYLADRFSFQGV